MIEIETDTSLFKHTMNGFYNLYLLSELVIYTHIGTKCILDHLNATGGKFTACLCFLASFRVGAIM